jgi:hypothetical protein
MPLSNPFHFWSAAADQIDWRLKTNVQKFEQHILLIV